MKTQRPLSVIAAGIGCAALFLYCGCSKSADSTTTVQTTKADGSVVTVAVSDTNGAGGFSDTWDRIKDFTYEKRADFSSGIDRMSKDMDEKTAEFRARVAGAPDAASRDRDSALKAYDDARADLKSKRDELDSATADTWSSVKAKTAEAWQNTKAAYDKVTKANGGS
jgi:hypothetical protein